MQNAEREAYYQAQAAYYLAETNRIIKRLANERLRHNRRRVENPKSKREIAPSELHHMLPAILDF